MKLYYSAGACSLSPHIALEESGLPYEAISAPTKTKLLPDGSDYRKVNPLGYVPYLINDQGEGLAEGPAIVQYIADQAPARSWRRPTAPGRATSCKAGSTSSAPSCTRALPRCSTPPRRTKSSKPPRTRFASA